MTTMAADVDELHNTLDVIASYLVRVRDLTHRRNASQILAFAWDWEMLREVLYPDNADSVYSGILLYGLQCLSEGGAENEAWRILIPEGTRRELLRHLSSLVNQLRRSERAVATGPTHLRDSRPQHKLTHFVGNPDWHEVLDSLSVVHHTESRIDRFLYLLERFARPSPMRAADIPQSKVQYYSQQMAQSRPGAERDGRNAADAFNLAEVAELSERSFREKAGSRVALVTATRAVRDSEEFRTVDPFLFVLEAEVRKRFPDRRIRDSRLCAMIATVFDLLQACRIDGGAQDSVNAELTRSQIPAFMERIRSLERDPVLGELSALLSKAGQAVKNASQQAESLPTEIELPPEWSSRVRKISRRIDHALQKLQFEQPTLADLGLQTEVISQRGHRLIYVIRDRSRDIIEGQLDSVECALRWDTDEHLGVFCEAMMDLLRSLQIDAFSLDIRVPNKPSVESYDLLSNQNLLRKVSRIAANRKLAFVRVRTRQISTWYEFGNYSVHDVRSTSTLVLPRIAVRFLRSMEGSLIGEFYSATAAEWLFPKAIATEVARICAFEPIAGK